MFKLNLITAKNLCEVLKNSATLERLQLEKRQRLITERTENSTRTLSDRQAERTKFQTEFDAATAKLATLPDGPEKDQLNVSIKELDWRLSKLSLYESRAVSPVDVVQEAYDVEETVVLLDLINRFITAIEARMAELPA